MNHSLPPLSALVRSNFTVKSSLPRRRRRNKPNVGIACTNCRQGHYSCDSSRPCAKCVSRGKEDTCVSGQYRFRQRPRAEDEPVHPILKCQVAVHPLEDTKLKLSTKSDSTPIECEIITTLDLVCAIVSRSIRPALGYYPAELEGLRLPSLFSSSEDVSIHISRGISEKKPLTCFEIQHLDPLERQFSSPEVLPYDVNVRHACGFYQPTKCSFRIGLTRKGEASHIITIMTTLTAVSHIRNALEFSPHLEVRPELASYRDSGKSITLPPVSQLLSVANTPREFVQETICPVTHFKTDISDYDR